MVDISWGLFATVVTCLVYSLGKWLIRTALKALVDGSINTVMSSGKKLSAKNSFSWVTRLSWSRKILAGSTISYIFITQYNKFQDHGHMMNIYEFDPRFAKYIIMDKSSSWKASRTCMAHFFTPTKMKVVMPSLLHAEQEFIKVLGEHADRGVETKINTLCERLTFDAVGKVAFGIDMAAQRTPDRPIFKSALAVLPNLNRRLFYELGQKFYHWPWLLKAPAKLMQYMYKNPLAGLTTKAADVIEYRRKNPQVTLPDMAQLLLDGLVGKENSDTQNFKDGKNFGMKEFGEQFQPSMLTTYLPGGESKKGGWLSCNKQHGEYNEEKPNIQKKKLVNQNLQYIEKRAAQCNYFATGKARSVMPPMTRNTALDHVPVGFKLREYLLGRDTTRLAMTYWFYLMGKHPEIQNKMRHEVTEAFKKEGEQLCYQTLTTLPYTNQVILETLRIYPPIIIFTNRCAEEDYRYGTYLIKKGTSVMAPTYQLHRDRQFWTEPEKFDPDRFSPEKIGHIDPAVYQPFGIGPRICVGQKLALLEVVSVAAQVLHNFQITLAPSQKPDLELDTYSFLAVPKEKVRIQLSRLKGGK